MAPVSEALRQAPAPAEPPPVPASPSKAPASHIPDIPFDYGREPGPETRSGPLPASLGAGEVLALDDYAVNGDMTFSCSGTEADPAFIVGGAIRNDGEVLRIGGSWCIFVDTVFDNVQVRTLGDHIILRGVEVANHSRKNCTGLGGNNIVLADSEIHHCQGNDRHGIHVSSGAENIWILRNHVHHNGGDGFQACHRCSANPPRNVYIGDNLFHSDRENGIDFKYVENVVVEGNTLHGYVSSAPDEEWCFDDGSGCGVFSSGSDGSAIAIGTDGGPINVLIVDNEVYEAAKAIRIEEGANVTVENNRLHDVGWCLQLTKNGYKTAFTGNTCEDAERGIFQNWRDQFSLTVDGNTFRNVTGPAIEYEARSVGRASTLTGNLFVNTGPVIYGNTAAAGNAEINALFNARDNVVR